MPSRLQHLHALREHLNEVLASGIASETSERQTGLRTEASAAFHWLEQSPYDSSDPRSRALVLAFGDDCPGYRLPRFLLSPLDGTRIPVRSVRGAYAGELHAAPAAWVRVSNVSHPANPPLKGTLGTILRLAQNPSQLLALTAGHVLGAGSTSAGGDGVTLSFPNVSMSAQLFDWAPKFVSPSPQNDLDAAVARISSSELAPLLALNSDWPLGASDPFSDDRLHLRTQSSVFSGGGQRYKSCRMAVGTAVPIIYFVRDALCWNAQQGFMGGDSGAPIWNSREELVAIHAGRAPQGSGATAVAIPIGRILRHWDARVVTRGEQLLRPAVPRNGEMLEGPPVEAGPPPVGAAPQPGAVPPAAPAAPVGAPVGGAGPALAVAPELVTLARTMWGEARGELDPKEGMGAVAHVVLNRVARRTYWGKSIEDVCLKPFQFSCWNARDPNLPKLLAVTRADARFALALDLAQEIAALPAAERLQKDRTLGATHYHTRQLQPPPRWARGSAPCARLGNHLFYKNIA